MAMVSCSSMLARYKRKEEYDYRSEEFTSIQNLADYI